MLTHAGRTYLSKAQPALRTLAAASLELLANRGSGVTLTLASVPTFTTKWLTPRPGEFSAAHPNVTLNFRQHLSGNDPFPPEVDAAIRFGDGTWPGVISEYIAGHEYMVCCTPVFLRRHPLLRRRAAFNDVALLQHHAVPSAWSEWCSARRVTAANVFAGPRFEQYVSLIRAAAEGMGLALAPKCLLQDELASGELVEPFDSQASLAYGHFLCYMKDRLDSPVLQSFRTWLHLSSRSSVRVQA